MPRSPRGARVATALVGLVGVVLLAAGLRAWTTGADLAASGLLPAAPAAGTQTQAVAPAPPRGTWTPRAPRIVSAPAAGIRARVVPVRARGSTLLPPVDPARLGWWSDGAPAGALRGTALLTGHAVSGGGGALDRMDVLRPGDVLTVQTAREELTYAVTEVMTLSKDVLASRSARLFRQTGPHRLAVVTCADWDGSAFRSNTVVLARPVSSRSHPAADTDR